MRNSTARAERNRSSTLDQVVVTLGGRAGDELVRCPAHDDHTPSLAVRERGGQILLHCHAGCSQSAVIEKVRELGLRLTANDPGTAHADTSAAARRIWTQTRPADGTGVEQYLRSRGIVLPKIPEALRYHPSLRHADGSMLPAMVAGVQDVAGAVVAIHRTFLRPDGSGKADVEPAKKMLGKTARCAVRITQFAERMIVGEGIETVLSVNVATGLPALAALSTTGMLNLELPPEVRDIIIAADPDEPGRAAASRAAARWRAEGRTVRIAVPLAGDFNDVLREQGAPRVIELIEAARDAEVNPSEPVAEATEAPPLDVFGDATLAGSPELGLDMLPRVIANAAADIARRVGCDPAAAALPMIVVAAAATDDRYVIQPRRHDTGWTESARLWVATIAEPGEHKTPMLVGAVAPLLDAEARWFDDDRRALQRYEIDRKVYLRDVDRFIKSGGHGNLPVEPVRPRVRRTVIADCTIEAVSEVLVDNPRGVLAQADELSGWFGSFDAYRSHGGQDRAAWIEAFNGGRRAVDRIRRGRVQVENWSVSIVGGIQPGPMRRIASKISDDGLLQRFLVAFLRPSTRGEDREPDHCALRAYRDLVFRLVDLQPPEGRRVFTLSPEAQVEQSTVSTAARNVKLLPDTSAAFRGHLAKWEGLFARGLLTYHMIEHDERTAIVSGETARKVARLMLDYLLPNAARFYTEVLGHEHLTHARWIAGYILAHASERITPREIGRACHELYKDRDALIAAMESLALAGWVTPVQGVGKHPTGWRVNPRVHRLFAERGEHERKRREAVRRQIADAAAALGLSRMDA